MLSIRFTRIGRKKTPLYRIVIMDKRKDPWGKYLEKLGFYNPRTKETQLNKERIEHWLSMGAKASETVFNLFIKNGIVTGDKQKSVKITKKRTERIERVKSEKAKAESDKKASADAKALADKEAEAEATELEAQKEAEATKDIEETPIVETSVEEAKTTEEVPVAEETSKTE